MNATNKKNSKDYNNGKIYQVLNRINNEVYVGSTCQLLRKRMDFHRYYAETREGKLYDEMRRLGKEHFYIELIVNHPCNDISELVKKEQFYTDVLGTLNKNTSRQADDKEGILELRVMVYELQTRLEHIEHQHNTKIKAMNYEMNRLLNRGDTTSPQHFDVEEQGSLNNNTTHPDDINKDIITVKEMVHTLQTRIDRTEHQNKTTTIQIKYW
jgi:SHS2 domain-containing protein